MRPSVSRLSLQRAVWLGFVSCAILIGALALPGARALAAAGEPVIASESVSNITEHSARLEAQIDPSGLETAYEFWVESANCQPGPCGSISVASVGHGYIPAGSTYQTVKVELSDLQLNYSYTYWVFAINSAGWAKGSGNEFKAVNPGGGSAGGSPLPPAENTATPFERPAESWIGRTAAEGVSRELAEAEQERKAREAANQPPMALPIPKGQWCGEAGVACESGEVTPVRCVVPSLHSDSLVRARQALDRAHCSLGKVSRPRGYHGPLVVIGQRVRPGRKLSSGTPVAITLGHPVAQRKSPE